MAERRRGVIARCHVEVSRAASGMGLRPSLTPLRAAITAALLLLVLGAPAVAAARERAPRRDRSATLSYLRARYRLVRLTQSRLPASQAAVEGLATRMEAECPGVLSGAPRPAVGVAGSAPASSPGAADSRPGGSGAITLRERGTIARQLRQRGELTQEIQAALTAARLSPMRGAVLAFARRLRSLRWTSPALTRVQHATAKALDWEARLKPQSLCPEMRAWVASGFSALSPVTRRFGLEEEAALGRVYLALFGSAEIAITPHGELRSQKIQRKISRIEDQEAGAERELAATATRLQSVLGVIDEKEAREREPSTESHERSERRVEEPHVGHHKGSVVIAKGRSAAGATYTIAVARHRPHARGCAIGLTITESGRSRNGGWSSASTGCMSSSHLTRPTVECHNGLLVIEAQTLPAARSVRLKLSDGRMITSPVAIVPRRLGGPAGFYHQAVHGPSPTPISMAEINAHGRVIRTVKLPQRAHCAKPQQVERPATPRPIVTAKISGYPAFAIIGERQPSRKDTITVESSSDLGAFGGALLEMPPHGSGLTVPTAPARHSKPLRAQVYWSCRPHDYAIAYGILRDPRDQVLARVRGRFVPLQAAHIPGSLHLSRVLAYAVLPEVPGEIIVRAPSGKTVFRKRFTQRRREAREFGAGEAEPAS